MCTRVFLSDFAAAKVVGRTLDISFPDDPHLWWLPAGMTRHGHPDNRQFSWTSRYGSLVITDLVDATIDGMNDRGLSAHALMFTTADYERPDDRPALAITNWVQYVVDSFSCVADAVAAAELVRVVPIDLNGLSVGVHIAMEDANGDSAIIEPIDGAMVIHHGPQYRIMANSPSMDEQLVNLARYHPFGGELPPPGDITSTDRFVRAHYFHHYLPEPSDSRMALAEVMQVLSAVAKPLGVPYPDGDVYPTRWMSAADLVNLDYYFWSRTSPFPVWTRIADFAGSGQPRRVALNAHQAAGSVTAAMVPPA